MESLPLRNPQAGGRDSSSVSATTRCSGSSAFGASSRNGFWQRNPGSFEGQAGLKNGKGRGLAEEADAKEAGRGQIIGRQAICS